ncbi:adenylate kinase [Agromyces tropicus]|uniref:Adenylate kinase n=1 Tax=Agromyces tropicus TaxID=555371 RepID=A0ABP5FB92_9MICO
MLGARDPLPMRPARVIVAGTSGSGKSTLAAAIGAALAIPYVEVDALYHGPGWVPRPEFDADIAGLAARDAWAAEWQYDTGRPVLGARADLAVWLDLPHALVMRRVVARTVHRRARGLELWNGNREAALRTVLTDRDHILRWAWRTRGATGPRVLALAAERPDLTVVRLRSAREVQAWLRGPLADAASAGSPR